MSTERDTRFQGFASLLWQELLNALDQMDTDMDIVDGCSVCSLPQEKVRAVLEPIIARRAYDLTEHNFNQVAMPYNPGGIRGFIHLLEDMSAWPEQERFVNALSDLAKIHAKLQNPD